MLSAQSDEHFMKQAHIEAAQAFDAGEVPVGVVITCNNRIIARAHNQTELLTDATAHAEMLAITAATNAIGGKYLTDCTLYVSLEPCVMCAGAMAWAQLGRLVFGADDEKKGFMRFGKTLLHPKTKVECGILAGQSKELLQAFFQQKR